MVNHVRCLLLNLDGTGFQPGIPGEEFVDPSFRALTLPPALKNLRRFVFGPDPDRVMLNYRLCQIMTMIHSCELADFITALDPRITYWPPRPAGSFDKNAFGTTVLQTAGAPANLYVQGPRRLTAMSQLLYAWEVSVVDNANVSVRRLTTPFDEQTVPYTSAAGLSSQVQLTGSPLLAVFNPVPGAVWVIRSIARPAYGPEDVVIAVDHAMSLTGYDDLFAGDEPYRTFGNLWTSQVGVPYRLGALALALAYRCDTLRTQ
jgi:hypothetical protein